MKYQFIKAKSFDNIRSGLTAAMFLMPSCLGNESKEQSVNQRLCFWRLKRRKASKSNVTNFLELPLQRIAMNVLYVNVGLSLRYQREDINLCKNKVRARVVLLWPYDY